MTAEDYLIAAWLRGAPNALVEKGFPRGFWPDVARAAVEMALAGRLDAPLSFRQTMCTRDQHEGKPEVSRPIKGLDVSKLEFKL